VRRPEEGHGDRPLHPADRGHPRRGHERRLLSARGSGPASFKLHKFVSEKIVERGHDYRTGVVYTTNRRVWEHDQAFQERLRAMTCIAIDMETATLFIVGHHNQIARGALLLVSDVPITPDGVKTEESDRSVTENWSSLHLEIGIEAMTGIGERGERIKHFQY